MNPAQRCFKIFKPRSVTVNEFLIEDLAWPAFLRVEHLFHDSFEQSDVAVDEHLYEKIGQLGYFTSESPQFLRMFEAGHTVLRQRLDVAVIAAAPLRVQRRGQQPRM